MKARRIVNLADGRVHVSRTAPSAQCGKTAYTSKKVALHAAAMSRHHTGENIRAYKCGPCHCWHIGHPPGLPRTLATS